MMFYVYYFIVASIYEIGKLIDVLKKHRTLLILSVVSVAILLILIFGTSRKKMRNSRIQKIIKTHNSVNGTNSQFPTVSKSPSSTETVFRGDSIRIIPLKK